MGVTIATSLAEATAALAAIPTATVIAGGTDLMVGINEGRVRPHHIIDLKRVDELKGWHHGADTITIGAGMTYAEIEADPQLAAALPALAQAARTVGSPQIRNAGTIGGNLATCSPAGDTLPVLSAHAATIHIASETSTRAVAIDDFMVGPKRTSLQPGELIVSIEIPVADGPGQFLKVGTRNAMVISIASVAAVADHRSKVIRIALGSVGPTIIRATEAERLATALYFGGASADDRAAIAQVGEAAAAAATPIDDQRSTAIYRRHAIGICAARAIRRLLADRPEPGMS